MPGPEVEVQRESQGIMQFEVGGRGEQRSTITHINPDPQLFPALDSLLSCLPGLSNVPGLLYLIKLLLLATFHLLALLPASDHHENLSCGIR